MKNKKFKEIISVAILTVLIVSTLAAAFFTNRAKPYSESFLAMGTTFSTEVYGRNGKEVAALLKSMVTDVDLNLLSRTSTASKISELGRNKSAELPNEIIELIKTVQEISADSGGAVDITVGEITDLWQIGTSEAAIPDKAEIQKALSAVDYRKLKISGNTVTVGNGQTVDLGAVGKGYACDAAAKILSEHNAKACVFSAGGSILLYGKNPADELWQVAIRDPRGSASDVFAVFKTEAGFVSTSGDYERFFEKDGKSYHHIIDPKSGYPADSGIISVTVIADSGAVSDALSTACFVLGYEKSLPLLEKYNAQAIFVTKDKTVLATDEIRNKTELTNSDYHFAG